MSAPAKLAPFSVDWTERDSGDGTMVRVQWLLCRHGRAERTFNDQEAARAEAARLNAKYAKGAA